MITYQGKRRYRGTGPQPVLRGNDPLPLDPSLDLVKHSPYGFNWGYGGDGPKQLALALLLDVTKNPKVALQFYHSFTSEFVSLWPETWSITDDQIRNWLMEGNAIN